MVFDQTKPQQTNSKRRTRPVSVLYETLIVVDVRDVVRTFFLPNSPADIRRVRNIDLSRELLDEQSVTYFVFEHTDDRSQNP